MTITTETPVQNEIRLDAAAHGITLLRNNSGALQDKTGRWVRFGLGNESKRVNEHLKSSDLIGWRPTLITPHMVGQTVAIFAAIDAKHPKWVFSEKSDRDPAQYRFMQLVLDAGGCAGFARTVEEARQALWLG